VSAATEVSAIVQEIAAQSNDQARGIEEITSGLDQISVVIQSNTASAEESSSAAQELESQARKLMEIVNTFQLSTENDEVLRIEGPVEE